MQQQVVILKRVLLVLWSLWWTFVLAGNMADAARARGALPATFPLASGNYGEIAKATARYGPPEWVNGVLFGGVIVWELAATLLFWRACVRYRSRAAGRRAVYDAFTIGLALWLAFLIADEICIAYAVGGTHLRLFIAQLVTLLALELLPEE